MGLRRENAGCANARNAEQLVAGIEPGNLQANSVDNAREIMAQANVFENSRYRFSNTDVAVKAFPVSSVPLMITVIVFPSADT